MARAMLDCTQITEPAPCGTGDLRVSSEIAERLQITMPEVWVYESPDPNAFATGPSKNNAMVAVSTGLLANLRGDEVKSVLAHEMGHVFNGDMFSTTVLAGLMNTFVHYISNFVYQMVAQPQGRSGKARAEARFGIRRYIFLQVVLSVLAMLVVSWHSRRREYGPMPSRRRCTGKTR